MDDEHLKDFYAGLAMLGALMRAGDSLSKEDVARTAFGIAETMMEERSTRREQGHGNDGQSV